MITSSAHKGLPTSNLSRALCVSCHLLLLELHLFLISCYPPSSALDPTCPREVSTSISTLTFFYDAVHRLQPKYLSIMGFLMAFPTFSPHNIHNQSYPYSLRWTEEAHQSQLCLLLIGFCLENFLSSHKAQLSDFSKRRAICFR